MLRTGALKGLLRRSGGIGRSLTFVGEPRERASATAASGVAGRPASIPRPLRENWASFPTKIPADSSFFLATLQHCRNWYARGWGWRRGRVLQNQRGDQLWPPLTLPALLCADVHEPPVEAAQRPGASAGSARVWSMAFHGPRSRTHGVHV